MQDLLVLSARLSAVAALVGDGLVLADIGTDHAFVPIYLVENGRIPRAIALDINRGPLNRAAEHVCARGLKERISLRLSDGFSAVKPGEAETAVLAGMGGALMMRILTEGGEKVSALTECILQPQSHIAEVRSFLLSNGFEFLAEDMVKEDGKYYPIMKVRPGGKTEQWTQIERKYGKLLLEKQHPVLREYLEKEIAVKESILLKLSAEHSERAANRAREIEKEREEAVKGLAFYSK